MRLFAWGGTDMTEASCVKITTTFLWRSVPWFALQLNKVACVCGEKFCTSTFPDVCRSGVSERSEIRWRERFDQNRHSVSGDVIVSELCRRLHHRDRSITAKTSVETAEFWLWSYVDFHSRLSCMFVSVAVQSLSRRHLQVLRGEAGSAPTSTAGGERESGIKIDAYS